MAPADREHILHAGTNGPEYCLTQTGPHELRIRTRKGDIRDVVVTEAVLNGSERKVVSLLDISERKKAELMLRHQAFHDPLTDLPNRFLLLDRLEHAIRRAKRGNNHFAVLFLDMDRFKLINDSLGHVAGDRLLEHMATKVRSCLREEDTLARFGGDEFVVLAEDLRDPPQPVRIAQRILDGIKGLRVQIGIDDFGTGYSSLSYLHRFPVDTLKIDRSFVMGLDSDNENAKIVKTIISLAHALGLNVVAEGIESADHLEMLDAMCCEYGQGYHFSRPVPARQVLRMLGGS
ncbi:EAL domain-containing protein [Desulfoplanes sp.]